MPPRKPAPVVADTRRSAKIELICDAQHNDSVLTALTRAKVSVWIGTANVKDIHLEAPIGTRARARGQYVSITEQLTELVRRGVEVRILHGALPSRPFRASLSKSRELKAPRFERIWTGRECGNCRIRSECPAPLDVRRARK